MKNKNDVRVNYDKITELQNDFIQWNDYLPSIIREMIFFEYADYLREHGDYENVMRVCIEKRPLTWKQKIEELQDWCKKHKEYGDLING